LYRPLPYVLLLPLVGACAGTGGAPSAPLEWPVGSFFLEATISYAGANGTQQDMYSADLFIASDGSMRMDSHVGALCRPPTPTELDRDARRRVRTFRCGDVTFELRPGGSATVLGELSAVVQEAYTEVICVQRASNGSCLQSIQNVSTRAATKQAGLRVRPRN